MQIDLLNTIVWQNYLIGMVMGLKKKDFKKPPEPLPRPKDLKKKEEPVQFAEQSEFELMMRNIGR